MKLSNKHVAAYYAMKTTFSDEHIDIDVLQEYAHGKMFGCLLQAALNTGANLLLFR